MRAKLIESNWCKNYVAGAKNRTVEENWHILKSKLIELRNKFVPLRKAPLKPRWKRGIIPITDEAKEAIISKKRAHRRWMSAKQTRNPEEARLHFTKARNKVKKILRKAKKLYERGIAMDAKKNPKKFWLHARSKLNTKTGVAPLLENVADKNSLRFDDKGKADLLQRQFLSVFT